MNYYFNGMLVTDMPNRSQNVDKVTNEFTQW